MDTLIFCAVGGVFLGGFIAIPVLERLYANGAPAPQERKQPRTFRAQAEVEVDQAAARQLRKSTRASSPGAPAVSAPAFLEEEHAYDEPYGQGIEDVPADFNLAEFSGRTPA